MKQDLTTGTWQDDTGCPISIILVSTSDVDGVEHCHHRTDCPNNRQKEQGHNNVVNSVVALIRIGRHGGQRMPELTGNIHCQFVVKLGIFRRALLLTVLVLRDVTKCIHLVNCLMAENPFVHVVKICLHQQDCSKLVN